jgi:hypothetical protein
LENEVSLQKVTFIEGSYAWNHNMEITAESKLRTGWIETSNVLYFKELEEDTIYFKNFGPNILVTLFNGEVIHLAEDPVKFAGLVQATRGV